MEKIRIALEKARREQTLSAPGRAMLDEILGDGAIPPPGRIIYTQTRVLRPDPSALARARIVMPAAAPDIFDIHRMLRTQMLQRMKERGARTLAITSAGDGEGKSVTAVNLAICVALTGQETALLVDLNLRRPSIAGLFGVKPEYGIEDYLVGRASLRECLFSPAIDRLVVLPAHRASPRSSELLASPIASSLALEIRNRYADRIIIYDTPAITTSDDALMFERHIDAFILVIREGQSTEPQVRRAIELMGAEKLLGTILVRTND